MFSVFHIHFLFLLIPFSLTPLLLKEYPPHMIKYYCFLICLLYGNQFAKANFNAIPCPIETIPISNTLEDFQTVHVDSAFLSIDNSPKPITIHFSYNLTASSNQYSRIRPWMFEITHTNGLKTIVRQPKLTWFDLRQNGLFVSIDDVIIMDSHSIRVVRAELLSYSNTYISCLVFLNR